MERSFHKNISPDPTYVSNVGHSQPVSVERAYKLADGGRMTPKKTQMFIEKKDENKNIELTLGRK